jgi:hypothetical protein
MYDHKIDLCSQIDTSVFLTTDNCYLRLHLLANVEIYRECEFTYQDSLTVMACRRSFVCVLVGA